MLACRGHTSHPRLYTIRRQATDWPNSALEDHIRPAAKRAGITKRIGWHALRHTFGTLFKANGEDVVTVQALMRHANVSLTMNTYVQAATPAKRNVQRGIIKQIREVAPDPNLKCLQVLEKMAGAIGFEPTSSRLFKNLAETLGYGK